MLPLRAQFVRAGALRCRRFVTAIACFRPSARSLDLARTPFPAHFVAPVRPFASQPTPESIQEEPTRTHALAPTPLPTNEPARTHLIHELASQASSLLPSESNSPSSDASPTVTLCGWLQSSRVMGGLMFGVLRDWSGVIQLIWSREDTEKQNLSAMFDAAAHTPLESVIRVKGTLRRRPQAMVKEQSPSAAASLSPAAVSTGELELMINEWQLLNASDRVPIDVVGDSSSGDDARLRYRFVDLRRPVMQNILRLRAQTSHEVRQYLTQQGCIEVETPYLFKSTPEGANEFLVPSRLAGRFFALPQSPQQHKQLLMVGGVDKYFQIARCFRDEGGRTDRQPEFTQIDVELSFVTQRDVMRLIEGLVRHVLKEAGDYHSLPQPLPIMTYHEAMNRFGSDKPDTRYGMEIVDVFPILRDCQQPPPYFAQALSSAASMSSSSASSHVNDYHYHTPPIRALRIPGGGKFTQKEMEVLQREATRGGAKGLMAVKVIDKDGQPSLKLSAKDAGLLEPDVWAKLQALFASNSSSSSGHSNLTIADPPLGNGDVLLFLAGRSWTETLESLGRVRLAASALLQEKGKMVLPARLFNFMWVVDFPLFDVTPVELSPESNAAPTRYELASMHHPFTSPHPDDLPVLQEVLNELFSSSSAPRHDAQPGHALTASQLARLRRLRGQNYDIVVNGVELGGGSIRIHHEPLQRQVFDLLGAKPQIFAHLLEALRLGCPPHGGAALGLDRFVALMGSTGPYSLRLRDVIAFPKSSNGFDLLTGAPSFVPQQTLDMYHIESIGAPSDAADSSA